jgi:hypothetical protein
VKRTPLKRTPPKWQADGDKPRKPLRRTQISTRGHAKTRAGQVRLALAKAEVRGRSGGACEANTPACPPDRHPADHAHHVQPRSAGGLHDADNLLDVCNAGHRWIHANPAASYDAGWLRHEWTP